MPAIVFRKKPPEFLAWQYDPEGDVEGLREWCGARIDPDGSFVVETGNGDMPAEPGDWIVRVRDGVFYPYTAVVFNSMYELG